MIKKITLLFFAFSVNIITAQPITMTDSGLFSTGANATWNTIFTAAIAGNETSGLAQTVVINITNLGDGTTYRIYKTLENGNADFTQQGALTNGVNTITVPAVEFNRNVKFQFSGSGSIEFDSFSLNGVVLYPFEEFECEETTIGESNLFVSQEVDDWPYYLTAALAGDDGTNMNTDHSFEMTITCLPVTGATYRILKTNSAGNDINCCVAPLTLGVFSKTVAGVTWDRNLRFQFSTADIGFSSLSVNGSDVLGLEDVNSSVFNIYPNPATGTIFVDGVQNIKSIKVYSILGSLEKEVFNTNQVDISELSSGIHLIKVDNGTITTKKIIKQ